MSTNSMTIKLGLDGLQNVTNGLKSVALGVSSLLGPLAASAAAYVSVSKGIDVMVQSFERVDSIAKAAERIGDTTENISNLAYAARLSDVAFEDLESSLRKLTQWYDRTGGSAATLRDMLLEQADYFEKLADGPQKTSAALERFGKSGAALIPILNGGRSGIVELEKEAERLGITIDSKSATAVKNLNDQVEKLKATAEGLGNRLASISAPFANDFLKVVTGVLKELNLFGSSDGGILDKLKTFASAQMIQSGAGIVGMVTWVKELSKSLWNGGSFKDSLSGASTEATKAWHNFVTEFFKDNGQPKALNNIRQFVAAQDDIARFSRLQLEAIGISKNFASNDPFSSDSKKRESLRQLNAEALKQVEIRERLLLASAPKLEFGKDAEGDKYGSNRYNEEQLKFLEEQNKLREEKVRLMSEQDNLGKSESSMQWTNAKTDLKNYFNELGNMAASVADGMKGIFNSAIGSISSGLTGLIQGTMTWGQALANIGSTILSAVIGAITQMIAKLLIVKAISLFIPGGGILGMSLFADGGYTGPGGRMQPAGIVHKGEFVMPADATNRIGIQNLEALRQGIIPSGMGSGQTVNDNRLVMGVFNNQAQTESFLRSNQGRKLFVDLYKQTAHERGRG